MKKTVSTKEVAGLLGLTEAEVEAKAAKEGWVSVEDMKDWGETLREAKRLHESGVPHFVVWLTIIQMCEKKVLTQDILMDLIRENGLCTITDQA